MTNKKLVFITGATGNMGSETVKEFLRRTDKFRLRLLSRDTKSSKKNLRKYILNKNVEVIYGDLKDEEIIKKCVTGVDFVLHIGALVSPAADDRPEECMRVNCGSTKHIIKAIKEQPNPDEIGFAFIGSVGETGDRPSPIHWGRCGDPIKPSMFDYYSVSKIASERMVIESDLKKWVVLRQSGMLPVNEKAIQDPITYHQNLNNVLEWSTAKESAKLMANICEDWIPNHFWREVYNISSGDKWRFSYFELMEKMLGSLDIEIKSIYNPKELALYNFHGHWYTDADKLEEIAKFRFIEPDNYFNQNNKKIQLVKAIPFINKLLPSQDKFIENLEIATNKERGPKWMINNNKEKWIKSFYGSLEKKNSIKSWEEGYELLELGKEPTYLDHGYDETKSISELSIEEIREAAKFRGGECLSSHMSQGDLYTPLMWQCHKKHNFSASPYLILKAGHWCPVCEKESWDFANYAKHSPFFAQVWTPIHGTEDQVIVKKIVSEDILD